MPRNDGIIRLSPSVANEIVSVCPRAGWAKHRLLGNLGETTASNIEGKLWHAAVLGHEDGEVAALDFDSFRTKEAREARDEATANGQIPVTRAKWEEYFLPGAHRVREELYREGIELHEEGAESDVSVEERIEWVERASNGNEVQCSGVIDYRHGFAIEDMKSHGKAAVTQNIAEQEIAKSHALLQAAAYPRAIAQLHGVDYERVSMRFLFFQTVEPYMVTPVDLDGEFQHAAELRWQRAIDIWEACLSKGTEMHHWPGPAGGKTITAHAPGWLVSQELEHEEFSS